MTMIEKIRAKVLSKAVEAQNLPEGEKIYLKKDMFGWRVINPPEKWWHLIIGSKRNLYILIFLLFLALMIYLGMNELIGNYKTIAANPCDFCKNCFDTGVIKLNLSGVKT